MCVQSPVEAIARILASSAKKTPSHLGHSHLVLTRPKCESRGLSLVEHALSPTVPQVSQTLWATFVPS